MIFRDSEDDIISTNCARCKPHRARAKTIGNATIVPAPDEVAQEDPVPNFPFSLSESPADFDGFIQDYEEIVIRAPGTGQEIALRPENQIKCSDCPRNKDPEEPCPYKEEFCGEWHFALNVQDSWVRKYRLNKESQLRGYKSIRLSDLRWNGFPVKLNIRCPRITEYNETHALSLGNMRFFKQHLTTRLANTVAQLYRNHSRRLIQESYALAADQVSGVVKTYEKLCTKEVPEESTVFLMSGTLGKRRVFYVIDAKKRTLLDVCTADMIRDENLFWKYQDCAYFCMADSFESERMLLSLDLPCLKLSYRDIYDVLWTVYQHSDFLWRERRTVAIAHNNLRAVLNNAFEQLKNACHWIDEEFDLYNFSQSELEKNARTDLLRHLRRLTVLAGTVADDGARLVSELAAALDFILLRDVLEIRRGYRWHELGKGEYSQILSEIFQFRDSIQQYTQQPEFEDFEMQRLRLVLFNEACTAKLYQQEIIDVFSQVRPEQGEDQSIRVRAPRLTCLIHLISEGMLDTNSNVVDLPCVRKRFELGTCNMPCGSCPVLCEGSPL